MNTFGFEGNIKTEINTVRLCSLFFGMGTPVDEI